MCCICYPNFETTKYQIEEPEKASESNVIEDNEDFLH